MGKKINLHDYVERKRSTGTITIGLGEGVESVTVPPAELWPDEAFDLAKDGQITEALAKLMGHAAAERFQAAGGNWRILSGIIMDQAGASVGESEASSSS